MLKPFLLNTPPQSSPKDMIPILSYEDCLEDKRESYQKCSVLCCVRQLCTVIAYAVLKDECWFRFRISFVRLFRFCILYVFLV